MNKIKFIDERLNLNQRSFGSFQYDESFLKTSHESSLKKNMKLASFKK